MKWEFFFLNGKKKKQFWFDEKKVRLQYRYQDWTLVSVPIPDVSVLHTIYLVLASSLGLN
jgi:hypothetical protein